MEVMALKIDPGDFGVADLDPDRIGVGIDSQRTLRPVLMVVTAISWTMTGG
jgi:hypothetical protein